MSETVKPSRSYNSTGRQAQARLTRSQVLEAAHRRFLDLGYAATTIPAIAHDAGVSVETIYKAFGNKAGLLKAVFDVALAGDDDPVPMNEREPIAGILAEPDPCKKLRRWADFYVTFAGRAVPLLLLARSAATSDTAASEVWRQMVAERRGGMAEFASHLLAGNHLRTGVDVEEATDVLWFLNSPEAWELLVMEREWTPEHFGHWVYDMAVASLL
jgi:AcrR family transcriptional regulator